MLLKAWHWQKLISNLKTLSKNKCKIVSPLFSSLLPLALLITPAKTLAETLGVVKSEGNDRQWSEITNRLQQTGIDYCFVDASTWEREFDLSNISVLLLPNIENITGAQAIALERWMNRGGKVIVTGPTGNLSQPEVRSRLRSLFGAYWGFPLSSPATLELASTTPLEWSSRPQLSRTFMGGAVIPDNPSSQTAAVWLAEGNPAAAVVTHNSTVLGWRWGVNAVSSASLDASWLQAALNRYGISTYGNFAPQEAIEATSCQTASLPLDESRPFLPRWQLQQTNSLPESRFNLGGTTYSPQEVETMSQELEGLIGRFESTLLTVDANHSDINISTGKLIQKLLTSKAEANKSQSKATLLNNHAHQALEEAKDKQKKFLQLVNQGDYIGAKREWLDARRILWDNYPSQRQLPQSEIRAMWLDRGTIVRARSESDLAEIFDRMATAGINTVFFETVNAGYPVYYSRIAPQQNPLIQGWDPLKAAVKLAHERGMELHAWVWTFAAGNQRHNTILNLPQDYLGPLLSRYPDWLNSDRDGNPFHYNSGKVFLDPANPGVRRYLSLLIEEIATNYQVDGIHLDYIRYPFQSSDGSKTYGYGIAGRQQFKQLTGTDPLELTPSSFLWSQWNGFRIKQVDSFVETISQELKQRRSDLILSTAVFPIPRYQRLEQIQQNWEEWIKNGWIDMLVPMTYAPDTDGLKKLTSPLFEEESNFASRTLGGAATLANHERKALILPSIRLLNMPDVVAMDQMQLLRGMPADGFALFAAENFSSNLADKFAQTQGSWSLQDKQPLPYRQPFQATLSRYQALQKEWNYLLSNNHDYLREITIEQWGSKADELASAFEKLANDPSSSNLESAKIALSSFQRRFPYWMEEIKIAKPYQVEAWSNRLVTLDNLLSYGENKLSLVK